MARGSRSHGMNWRKVGMLGVLVPAFCLFLSGCSPRLERREFAISGRVSTSSGKPIEGVTISFGGGTSGVVTDQWGHWQKSHLTGTVTVTPGLGEWAFVPVSRVVSGVRDDVDFTAVSSLRILTTKLPEGKVGEAYETGLTATGGLSPYRWRLAVGELPPGLLLDEDSGLIMGTPSAQGEYALEVEVGDARNPSGTARSSLSLHVRANQPPQPVPPEPSPVTYGISGTISDPSRQAVASAVVSFGVGTDGVTTDKAGHWAKAGLTGTVTVTPSLSGWSFEPPRREVSGSRSDVDFTAVRDLRILTSALPDGEVGQAYQAGLVATGGLSPYRWRLAVGELPPGLLLDENSGFIAGTPSHEGQYSFTLTVLDTHDTSQSSVEMTVRISPGPPVNSGNGIQSPGLVLVTWEEWGNLMEDANVVAQRVDSDGRLLDTAPVTICSAVGDQLSPTVAAGEECWLVVWVDHRQSGRGDLRAARVTFTGSVLDPDGVVLMSASCESDGVSAAPQGEGWLVSYNGADGPAFILVRSQNNSLIGERLPVPSDSKVDGPLSFDETVSIVGGSTGCLLVACAEGSDTRSHVIGAQFTSEGGWENAAWFDISDAQVEQVEPAGAPGSGGTLVVWWEVRYPEEDPVYGTIVPPGQEPTVQPEFRLSEPGAMKQLPAVASSGEEWFVTWIDMDTEALEGVLVGTPPSHGKVVELAAGGELQRSSPVAVWTGAGYFVAWSPEEILVGPPVGAGVRGVFVSPQGEVAENDIILSQTGTNPSVAANKLPTPSRPSPRPAQADAVVGRYFDPLDRSLSLEISSDGTFSAGSPSSHDMDVGRWRRSADRITLSFPTAIGDLSFDGQVRDSGLLFVGENAFSVLGFWAVVWVREGADPGSSDVGGHYVRENGDKAAGEFLNLDVNPPFRFTRKEGWYFTLLESSGAWSNDRWVLTLNADDPVESVEKGVIFEGRLYFPHMPDLTIWKHEEPTNAEQPVTRP